MESEKNPRVSEVKGSAQKSFAFDEPVQSNYIDSKEENNAMIMTKESVCASLNCNNDIRNIQVNGSILGQNQIRDDELRMSSCLSSNCVLQDLGNATSVLLSTNQLELNHTHTMNNESLPSNKRNSMAKQDDSFKMEDLKVKEDAPLQKLEVDSWSEELGHVLEMTKRNSMHTTLTEGVKMVKTPC